MNPQGYTKVEPKLIKVHKLESSAELPRKTEGQEGDIGFDVTIIGRTENRTDDEVNKVNMFHTGIQIKPPEGYYLEMFAKSSLSKYGYFLATGTSIIDPGYEGELLVPLLKFDPDKDDIPTPFSATQLVLKKIEEALISAEEISFSGQSVRGDGGFGSTGQYTTRSDPTKIGYDPIFDQNPYSQGQRRPTNIQNVSSQFY